MEEPPLVQVYIDTTFREVRTVHTESIRNILLCPKVRRYGRILLSATLVNCANSPDKKNSIEFPDASQFSHEQLIQQACTATVNSTSQLLTCTLVAVVDVGQRYRKALADQMSLLEESLSNIGNDGLQEELTDLITAARHDVDTLRRNFLDLDSLMNYVEKMVESATETSFLAGAETACTVLSERLYSAKIMIKEQKKIIKTLEEELVKLQEEIIKRDCNPDDKNDR